MKNHFQYDVIIVGGSYAGLSAALALGRSLRKVLVIDSGKPCNRYTPHSHNFITQDGVEPQAIARTAREQIRNYKNVEFLEDRAISANNYAGGFQIVTSKTNTFVASKLIFATGIVDELPDIPGLRDCWGISVIHCPYCHGYEYHGKPTAIFAKGERAFHLATLVSNLTGNLSIITGGPHQFNGDQLNLLRHKKIEVIESKIIEVSHHNGYLNQIALENNRKLDLQALYAAVPFSQHSDIPAALGCGMTEDGYIKVDPFQKTSVEGIYACGDNSFPMRSVAHAVYSGNVTGAVVNRDLCEEEFKIPVT